MKPPLKIAKISPPKLSKVYNRQRLFKILDEARERDIIWVSAPAGSGKTTLITSYLNARKLPCLWYQIDAGDGDIASFFYYMGIAARQAAPHFRKPLPNLTPEYLLGLPTFTKNYFRELYSRVSGEARKRRSGESEKRRKSPFQIVLDNYQDAPANSPLHEIIQTGLSEMPEGINVIIISRVQPPDAMARIQASNNFTMLRWDDLKLTEEESIGIAKLRHTVSLLKRGGRKFSQELLHTIHEQTQGWVAGLVLMLEQYKEIVIPKEISNQGTHEAVFNYFAGEIFQRTDKETQEFLLKTAFLPKATAPMARQLTSMEAEAIFSGLIKNNYFTIKHFLPEPAYEYHPLFRQFLENCANNTFPSHELTQLKKDAASLLAKEGKIEAAVSLLQQISEWEILAPLILKHAPMLVKQGRIQTLIEWLLSIPEVLIEKQPWLLYWEGNCHLPLDQTKACNLFEKAYAIFSANKDPVGLYLSWAGIVESYIYQKSNMTPLERWISELEKLKEQFPDIPSPEIQARVASSMFMALMYCQPHNSACSVWAERVHNILLASTDIHLKIILANQLILYYTWWIGDLAKALQLINVLQMAIKTAGSTPFPVIIWQSIMAAYYWVSGASQDCLQAVSHGLELARASGIHVWDVYLYAQGVYGTLTSGDLCEAEKYLKKMSSALNPRRMLDVYHYHFLASLVALGQNDLARSYQEAQTAVDLSLKAGTPYQYIVTLTALGHILMRRNEFNKARECYRRVRHIAGEMGSKTLEYLVLLSEAQLNIEYDDEAMGIKSLHQAISLAREQGIGTDLWWQPAERARFYAKALEAGIEVEYVQHLIRKRNLIPEEPPLHLDSWPWQIRVYTLGRFNVIKGQKPLTLTASSHKPLELLSALIAFGGRGISRELLIEALWPDAEGDVAHQNFETTLHRLRKLLGSDEMLVLKDGRLTLDDRYCWVDCWAFERLLTQLEHLLGTADAKPDEITKEIARKIDSVAKKIFNLYHGHFLGREADHSWSLTLRERLRSRFLRHIKDMGRYWKGHEKTDEAVKYYTKGLEIDPVSEGLYYGLMECHIELGDFAEALSVYKQCCHALKTLLNTAPSPKIDALYNFFRHDNLSQQEDGTSL